MFLYQPTSGYCYNSDSLFLYDFIQVFKPKGKLLDVGCGVGIIALLLSRDFTIETSIIDKQESMLEYAKLNFTNNNLQASTYLGDFTTCQFSDKFDFVVSNPPFYDSQVKQTENQHLNTARYAHHLPFNLFAQKVKKILKPRGYFIFCYDAKQIDILLKELKEINLNPEVIQFVHAKIDKESKLVMIASRLNSKSMTKILPPFIVMDEDNNYAQRAMKVFQETNTYSVKGDF